MANEHSGFNPQRSEKYEQRYGSDPVMDQRKETMRNDRQKPAREYFEGTLEKATKITHGMGIDGQGKPIVQTYQQFHKDFSSEGVFMAKKLLMVYFLKEWYGASSVIIDGDKANSQNLMEVADKSWKYTLTDVHWVEVEHV